MEEEEEEEEELGEEAGEEEDEEEYHYEEEEEELGEEAINDGEPEETPQQVEEAEQAPQQCGTSKQDDAASVQVDKNLVLQGMPKLSDAATQALDKARRAANGERNSQNAKKEYDQFCQGTKTKKFPTMMFKLQHDRFFGINESNDHH